MVTVGVLGGGWIWAICQASPIRSTGCRYSAAASSSCRAKRHRLRPGQQIIEQHVVDGQRDRLGQRSVQIPGQASEPLFRVGDAPLVQGGFQPVGDVVETGLTTSQQRVEVFQRAG
jgi:hypothetical protein